MATFDDSCGGVLGGHAVAIVGYDDSKQAFKIANSWGTGWGVNGYGWISYQLFQDAHFSVHYFLSVEDFPQEPTAKAFMVVDSELANIPTDSSLKAPLFYTVKSDFVIGILLIQIHSPCSEMRVQNSKNSHWSMMSVII